VVIFRLATVNAAENEGIYADKLLYHSWTEHDLTRQINDSKRPFT
jgi:hypothetical protein